MTIWKSREEGVKSKGVPLPDGNIPEIIRRWLWAREILDSETIYSLFHSRLADLKDPFLILDIEKAAERILLGKKRKEKICIYADFDLDGTAGLALLFDGLKQMHFENLLFYQPKRLSEGYGFHSHAVDDLHSQGVQLIITVDVGITAFAACQRAKELGIEIIITDHHQPSESLPSAFAVVNPNRKDESKLLSYLSGAGVAYYLLRAMKKIQRDLTIDLKGLLDCLAIATITDLVPLVGDNRILVKHGLWQLQHTTRPGLRALLSAVGLNDRPLTSQDVGIRFAPKINALSRLEQGLLPLDLFFVASESDALPLVEKVLDSNSARLSYQSNGEKEALNFLSEWPYSQFALITSKNFHRGVVGLIATKISQNLGVPTFVGSRSEEGLVVGSARVPSTPQKENVLKALESVSDLLNRFGGHPSAAGFEFLEEKKEQIVERLNDYFATRQAFPLDTEFYFDLEVKSSELSDVLLQWLEQLGPFGTSFDTPLFCIRQNKVKEVFHLRGGHKKLVLTDQSHEWTGLYFAPPENLAFDQLKGKLIDCLGEVQWNYFRGQRSVQLTIKDLRCIT